MITYAVKEVEFVCNRTVTQTGLSLLTEKKKKKKQVPHRPEQWH